MFGPTYPRIRFWLLSKAMGIVCDIAYWISDDVCERGHEKIGRAYACWFVNIACWCYDRWELNSDKAWGWLYGGNPRSVTNLIR